ncbi:MAG: nucleotide exchange factor GrpE [Elusimicrobia bacterium]|nr:nucleotide exchange factor GrpE [Elusimicrobiota bacterium]MDD7501857.1 nucleotide exchange factor GrpE [Elusimicrobiota bacterium]MDY5728754.1 nucleotide exchange factor GrpE [Elusimicrobiaceae bacterium]
MSKKHQEEAHQKHAEQQDETTQECACEKKAELVAEPEEKKPDYYEQLVRLSADFENYRKRTDREKASFLAYGKKEFAERLLPSYEVLLRQLMEMDKKEEEGQLSTELKAVKTGLKMVFGELEKAFKAEGIEHMDVLDKPYDPATQEVVAMIPSSGDQDGLVLQEVQMGFTMDGKVLRPARVIVGQHAEG